MLVQHMGEVPESLPVTEETRERLRSQANQLGAPAVLRLCDLLGVAVEDMRQGGDPRLPLELALVKVTRPGTDLANESLAYRIEQLEHQPHALPVRARPEDNEPPAPPSEMPPPAQSPPAVDLEQLQDAWQRSVLPAVEQRSIPAASVFREARPAELAGDVVTLEFPPEAEFHRKMAEEPKNSTLLGEALYEVTGRKLGIEFAIGEGGEPVEEEEPAGEEQIIELIKHELGAREVEPEE